jgi:hypothetical protein
MFQSIKENGTRGKKKKKKLSQLMQFKWHFEIRENEPVLGTSDKMLANKTPRPSIFFSLLPTSYLSAISASPKFERFNFCTFRALNKALCGTLRII